MFRTTGSTLAVLLPAVALAWATQPAVAQDYAQSFDVIGTDSGNGPANLIAQGYEFRGVLDPGLALEPWRV
jgi:hypothetical protein